MAKRLMAKVGEYEKDGQTKGRYAEIGVILSNDKGEYALLDPSVSISGALQQQNRTNHAAGRKTGDKLMCSIFDNSERGNSSGSANSGYDAPPAGTGAGMDDEIPFAPEWRI